MEGPRPDRLTTGEAAELCSVTPDTVLKWIKKGRLRAVRTPGGHYRIDPQEVARFLHHKGVELPPAECTPQPLRCWEYLSDRGEVREGCRSCIVYRVRAAWCFQVLGLGGDIGHAKQFCGTSCQECAYYRRVRGLATNVLVITPDEDLREGLAGQKREGLALRFARNGYEASALIETFRPAFAVVDFELVSAGEATLLRSLTSDPRVPGLRIILATPRQARRRTVEGLERGIVSVIEKPFGQDEVAAAIHSLPVESLALNAWNG